VSNGQQLRTGDPIGLAGNTGFSIEPHVHIQAYRKSIYGKDQVPISFQGRVLRMNDRFTVK
ncbi:MAG: M23 family metallopeptidase, partial [Chitinophagales bacterium]